MTVSQRKWWQDGVVYQIYPASFKDSNGDGIGDLQGIISELDYIKSIGVDIVWICPMYDSPQVDMGYDVSDYENVYPPYGTVGDMEELIGECHRRGMRIILDLVVNHTSDQHKWFQESRRSKDSPKRDWYIWRPARYVNGERKPPNSLDWQSNFTGSAWQWDELTQEYYLHLFCPEQPDLNWENEETRKAIYKSAMEFWLERGVDGFRVDTVNMYSKGTMMDAPITDPRSEWQFAGFQYCNGPRMSEFLSEMNAVLAKYDAMSVGECPHSDMDRVLKYVSAKEKQLNMVFQFDVVDLGQGPYKFQTTPKNFTLPNFKAAIQLTQDLIRGNDGWTTVFLENHDQSRSISRFASDAPEHRVASGRMLALMMTCLSGTMFIYQGQEIGMVNFPMEWDMSEYKDIDSSNYYNMVAERSGNDPTELLSAKTALQHLARDHARVPFSWSDAPNAGFTSPDIAPWMRVNEDTAVCNAKQQQMDKHSVLAFWKQMLQIRKEYPDIFVAGNFDILEMENPDLFTFTKTYMGKMAYVVCSFTGKEQTMHWPTQFGHLKAKMLVSSEVGYRDEKLAAYEGRMYLLA